MWVPIEMEVTFRATTSIGVIHMILKIITRTRTLKGGGFGLAMFKFENITGWT